MTVLDTVKLHNPRYKFRLLEQAADKLATHYESKKDSKAESDLIEFFERFPLSFTHSIGDITDYIKERYGVMNRRESLMDLVDAIRNLYNNLSPSDVLQYQDQLNVVCSSILDGSISADLATKMVELLNIFSTDIEKGVKSDVKSEQEGGVLQ